ncbi:MAG: hypothetical protein JXA91_08630 [Candidatus Thermoplasmatota archaeon]|nr:hypothetical protein [Candidatus Thermoplasmatota archaeon]
MHIKDNAIRHRHTPYKYILMCFCFISIILLAVQVKPYKISHTCLAIQIVGLFLIGKKIEKYPCKSTIRLSENLYTAIKHAEKEEGFKLSPFVREMLEKKFFDDNPLFIESKIEEEFRKKSDSDKNIERLQEKLKKAKEKQQQHEQRLNLYNQKSKTKTYRRIIPKEKTKSEGVNE